ncbi:glycerol-3-phosphate dehydrogenase [Rheinheimera sp. KL1]|uniref:glycerol-3-phosphate dehydrogenase n=1 Tax=Rheinheimera sp. KL1 TaxID=1635005 RepID=UPI0006A9AE8D|nr:glycerol-3-phosphate dehydrogenase [Rheinheimera sp. KL1]KOO57582.1 glycerol-3-phosphate dehydrogenase [Rheinheimera sp. KL1]
MDELANCHDVLIIGGGVNGTGIAADCAGRGLKVLLCEQNDLASATSSNSSKLIHGGLRYLEHYEFRLVKEALAEREVLLKNAPHIMWPMIFRLPHQPHLRPAWLIRLGLFLYDHLAKRVTLPASRSIHFGTDSPLQKHISKGFEYSDGWVDDSRLVVTNALAARQHGATICTRTRCIAAQRKSDHWLVTLQQRQQAPYQVKTKAIVNAGGPWVARLFDQALEEKSPQNVRLVKGSHIVVPKLHDQPQAYMLQNKDQRIIFVIPFEDNFTLIGTTDVEYQGEPSKVSISQEEVHYLLQICNSYFNKQLTTADIVGSFSGVRPLLDDESDSAQTVTRDYKLELSTDEGKLPLLSVFGGKITTYRKLAEAATDQLVQFFTGARPAWTAKKALPGGDFDSKESLINTLLQQYPYLQTSIIRRYVRSYGSRSFLLLKEVMSAKDLGQHFGHGLFEAEVIYLLKEEWAENAEDILWRRSKLGLYFTAEQTAELECFIQERHQPMQSFQNCSAM